MTTGSPVSPLAHVTVTVVNPEVITITTSQCKLINATSGEWRVSGTSTVSTNNNIQLYLTASVPADLNTNKLGAAPVAAGRMGLQGKTRTCLQDADQLEVISDGRHDGKHCCCPQVSAGNQKPAPQGAGF